MWTLDAEITLEKRTEADPVSMTVKLLAKNHKDDLGDYAYLEDNSIIQFFTQTDNLAEAEALGEPHYFENYQTSFEYFPADLGDVPQKRVRSTASCGPQVLGLMDGKGFREIDGEKGACGAYEDK